jgi:hypothetical protein
VGGARAAAGQGCLVVLPAKDDRKRGGVPGSGATAWSTYRNAPYRNADCSLLQLLLAPRRQAAWGVLERAAGKAWAGAMRTPVLAHRHIPSLYHDIGTAYTCFMKQVNFE